MSFTRLKQLNSDINKTFQQSNPQPTSSQTFFAHELKLTSYPKVSNYPHNSENSYNEGADGIARQVFDNKQSRHFESTDFDFDFDSKSRSGQISDWNGIYQKPYCLQNGTNSNDSPNISRMLLQKQKNGCSLCYQVSRQNYQLKQELLSLEDIQNQNANLKKEVQAMHELFELKEQQLALKNQQLKGLQQKIDQNKAQDVQFLDENVRIIKGALQNQQQQ